MKKTILLTLLLVPIFGCTPPARTVTHEQTGKVFRDCAECPEMVVIPAGSFLMGSVENESGRQIDEGPQHSVTIAREFAVGRFEVTVDEYLRFAQETGKDRSDWRMVGYPGGPVTTAGGPYANYPVRRISWQEAIDYLDWLSTRSGRQYRMLTEAEWEYAARAGQSNDHPWEPADTREDLPASAFRDSTPVGTHSPNGFGVYDMTGNASEWTADCYIDNYTLAPRDGSPVGGKCAKRVVRGGYSYDFNGQQNNMALEFMRISNRDWGYSDPIEGGNAVGLRIARSLP